MFDYDVTYYDLSITFNTVLTNNIIDNIPSPFSAVGINSRIHNNMTFICEIMICTIVTIYS